MVSPQLPAFIRSRGTAQAVFRSHYCRTSSNTMPPSPCRNRSLFRLPRRFSRSRCDVLQASCSSCLPLVSGACQRRWIRPSFPQMALGANPNVSSSLSLGSHSRPAGLGFNQYRLRHTRLTLSTQRIGNFPLHGLARMRLHAFLFRGGG